MAEQILRTCYSFVIYARDFSSALCDAEGNTVMQGSGDIAVHVGTLHFKAKAVIEAFGGDIHPGDVFAINDPYRGGTHFNDVSHHPPDLRRRRADRLRAVQRATGPTSAAPCPARSTSRPRSTSARACASRRSGSGTRGATCTTSPGSSLSNTRAPADIEGDLQAQAEATRVCEREILRLVDKYSRDTIVTAFAEVQDYVETPHPRADRRAARRRVGDGRTTSTPTRRSSEGLIPIKVKMTIDGDQIHYDLTGSHPAIETLPQLRLRRRLFGASSPARRRSSPRSR